MINVGFIGCGRIADLHYLGYKNNPHARVFAVCDSDPERAESRRAAWGAERAYTDYREMLHHPDIDAIEVLTPFETHEQVVIDAIRSEKHVAVQKPMAASLRSADRMVAAASQAGVIFKVTECYVTYPPIVLARSIIDAGEIGEPAGMRIKYICSPHGGWDVPASTYAHQLKKAAEGYGMETFDHGHHEWATAWYLLGEIERVSAWIDSVDGLIDCPAAIMWKYRDGKRYGICDFVYASQMRIPTEYYSNDEWYEVNGAHGILLVNRGTGHIHEGPAVSVYNGKTWRHIGNVPSDWSEGFIGSTRNFIGAIMGHEKPLLTGEQGREILRFSLAIGRSAALRREVYVDELDAQFPALFSWARRYRERKEVIVGHRRRSLLQPWGDVARYATLAASLTEQLGDRFDAEQARYWNCTVGLHLLSEGNATEEKFALRIAEGKLAITRGELPQDAVLTLRMSAGTWAAILMGKKKLETAVLTGQIKYEGLAQEGLKLRSAFKI